jgi:hypothetical protein
MAKNWIAGAIKHKGALHKELGVPKGKKIPAGKLAKAAKAGGKLGKRARLAETLEGFHHSAHANIRNPKTHADKLEHI